MEQLFFTQNIEEVVNLLEILISAFEADESYLKQAESMSLLSLLHYFNIYYSNSKVAIELIEFIMGTWNVQWQAMIDVYFKL